jgi:hypothetical protein
MKVSPYMVGFALVTAWACSISEDLPLTPVIVQASPSASPASSPVPSPTATPSPSTSPSPSPSPVLTKPPDPGTDPRPSPSPGASPSPSPSPSPSAAPLGPGSIDSIRVGFFGINCGRGRPVPRNGERILPVGCRGYVTATPKRANGDDVPAAEHGPDIDWFVLYGEDLIDVQVSTFGGEAARFNKDVIGVRPGAFGLCATVRGVTGCLIASVVP